jgi:hypothetical protein
MLRVIAYFPNEPAGDDIPTEGGEIKSHADSDEVAVGCWELDTAAEAAPVACQTMPPASYGTFKRIVDHWRCELSNVVL